MYIFSGVCFSYSVCFPMTFIQVQTNSGAPKSWLILNVYPQCPVTELHNHFSKNVTFLDSKVKMLENVKTYSIMVKWLFSFSDLYSLEYKSFPQSCSPCSFCIRVCAEASCFLFLPVLNLVMRLDHLGFRVPLGHKKPDPLGQHMLNIRFHCDLKQHIFLLLLFCTERFLRKEALTFS